MTMAVYDIRRDQDLSDAFGTWLSRHLERRRMSQNELARRMKVDPPTVHYYICGRYRPRLEVYFELCDMLELDPVEEIGRIKAERDKLKRRKK